MAIFRRFLSFSLLSYIEIFIEYSGNQKINFRNSKSAKKIPKKNHSIIGVLEIPNPKYLGKIQKKCYFEHPYES